MRKMQVGAIAITSFALLLMLGMPGAAMAQAVTTPYPSMAPIEQYLMDRTAEIALARSAAPEAISRDAEVLVLGREGFTTAVEGKNGFVCFVDRSWSSAPDPDFWNPKVRVPMCDNAAAARSHLRRIVKTADLALKRRTKAQIAEALAAAVARKELPAMEPGAMCYMLSKQGYGGDSTDHWPPHLMFFYPEMDPAVWGANLPGSPVLAIKDTEQHTTSFAITVRQWSDGTEDR
jgi:hypothetical protein